jgi:hypothetical protein
MAAVLVGALMAGRRIGRYAGGGESEVPDQGPGVGAVVGAPQERQSGVCTWSWWAEEEVGNEPGLDMATVPVAMRRRRRWRAGSVRRVLCPGRLGRQGVVGH